MSMSTNLISAIAALALSAAMYAASAAGEGGGYEFPKLIALAMCAMGIGMLIYEFGPGRKSADTPAGGLPWGRILPGLGIFVAYVFLIGWLGFFATSFLVFLVVALLYSPDAKTPVVIARIAGIAVAFMATLYGVFVLLLQVQFPQGVLF